ncbi:protein of unknown function [Candidatus Nitrosocosmicus franklandus]|uniref:Uncharacterized protein n=1 Tax=Candidatus Nitrosocosmicus franklandianus TaxID=1798806 RepID=A0A484IE62_9ARCH|nr:protein of unknown function [Candidatus Nitrosocosmicus franklandus]
MYYIDIQESYGGFQKCTDLIRVDIYLTLFITYLKSKSNIFCYNKLQVNGIKILR